MEWNLGLGGEYSVYTGCILQLNASGHLGSFDAFPIFNNLVSWKQQFLERKIHQNLYVIQFYVVIVCHFVKQSVKAPGLLVHNRQSHERQTLQKGSKIGFKTSSEFSSQRFSQNAVLYVWNSKYMFKDFIFENYKMIIIRFPIIWKMSHRRAKWVEI